MEPPIDGDEEEEDEFAGFEAVTDAYEAGEVVVDFAGFEPMNEALPFSVPDGMALVPIANDLPHGSLSVPDASPSVLVKSVPPDAPGPDGAEALPDVPGPDGQSSMINPEGSTRETLSSGSMKNTNIDSRIEFQE